MLPDRGQYRAESQDINPKASLSRINAQDSQPPTSVLPVHKKCNTISGNFVLQEYIVQKVMLSGEVG